MSPSTKKNYLISLFNFIQFQNLYGSLQETQTNFQIKYEREVEKYQMPNKTHYAGCYDLDIRSLCSFRSSTRRIHWIPLYIFFFSKKYIFFLYHFYVIKKEVYERDSIKHCFITPLYTYGVSYLLGITQVYLGTHQYI